jgi:hypothetical protein
MNEDEEEKGERRVICRFTWLGRYHSSELEISVRMYCFINTGVGDGEVRGKTSSPTIWKVRTLRESTKEGCL